MRRGAPGRSPGHPVTIPFFREPFGWRELVAMVVIFAGVAVVKSESRKPAHV
jgi:drug/metabolite transporter (DMT)-like permease